MATQSHAKHYSWGPKLKNQYFLRHKENFILGINQGVSTNTIKAMSSCSEGSYLGSFGQGGKSLVGNYLNPIMRL